MNYRTRQPDNDIRTRRSIARLLSLADMVERSSMQFVLFRVFLLWLLRPTEWRVRNHVFEIADEAGLSDLPDIFNVFDDADGGYLEHNSPDEALDMALRLRALAGLWAWLYGLDISSGRIGNALYWANYWRHMRWLAYALQASAGLHLIAGQSACRLILRPEVRAAPPQRLDPWRAPRPDRKRALYPLPNLMPAVCYCAQGSSTRGQIGRVSLV